MLGRFKQVITSYNKSYLIVFGTFFFTVIFASWFASSYGILKSDPITITLFALTALGTFSIIATIVLSSKVKSLFRFRLAQKKTVSKLRKRVLIAFSLGAALPTIVVAIFSIYFFNISVQTWFDSKVTKVLDQSVIVGESYVSEHIIQLKETSISIAEDLSTMYYDLASNSELFTKVLNAQAEMRSIDEALVFQKNTNTILAQTTLSFSLPFVNIPNHLLEKADSGEVVQIPAGHTKIRMLIKLQDHSDTYLLLGRLIDTKIIDHISKTEGAVSEYKRLKDEIGRMQIKFSLVFLTIALLLIFAAIVGGQNFAARLVLPIRNLVIAAEKVKNGDLSIQIPDHTMKKDELKVLTSAFNRMVQQLDRQQKDLVVAQRALAWSDVARQIAHEIKNPLTPIQLATDRLTSKFANEVGDKEAFLKYTKTISRHSEEIRKIVSEFINFARMPAPVFLNCNIVKLIADIIDSRRLINDKINYNFHSNATQIDFVCDQLQISRVMENLLQNSEEAMKDTKKPSITVSLLTEDNMLYILLEDNGPGIPLELKEDIKKPYVTSKETGTGLGLAIVDRIVQDHMGSFEITNNEVAGITAKLNFNLDELKRKLDYK